MTTLFKKIPVQIEQLLPDLARELINWRAIKINRFQDKTKYLFSNRIVEEWNLLTEDIVSCSTLDCFKNKLDHYLRSCWGFI